MPLTDAGNLAEPLATGAELLQREEAA